MESERPIEKSLRKLAAQRRAEQGADLELHPATRRLLQGEVSRQYAKRAGAGSSSWTAKLFGSFWMRAAWSASLIVVLGFFLTSELTHRSDRFQLASVSPEVAGNNSPKDLSLKTDGISSSDLASETPRTANLDASGRSSEIAKNMAGKESEAPKSELADALRPAPAAAPLQNSTPAGNQDAFAPDTRARDRRLGLETLASTRATAGAVTPQAPQGALASAPVFKTKPLPGSAESNGSDLALNPAPSVARMEQRRDAIGVAFQNSQQFVTERSGSKKAQEAHQQAVLDQFNLSQQGSQLRVQDMDGSVYLGEVVPENHLPMADKAVDASRKMRAPPGAALRTAGVNPTPGADQFYFQVSGTNRSLNRRVVFRGRVETSNEIAFDAAASNRAQAYGLSGGSASNSSQLNNQQYRNTANQMQLNLQNSRVSGTAEIEGARNQEIRAVPSR